MVYNKFMLRKLHFKTSKQVNYNNINSFDIIFCIIYVT